MKKNFLFFFLVLVSFTGYSQVGSLSQSVYRSRVNDTTSVSVPTGWGGIYYSNASGLWWFKDLTGWHILGSGGLTTASEGLNVVGSDVQMGGGFSNPITISGTSSFDFSTSDGYQVSSDQNLSLTSTSANVNLQAPGAGINLTAGNSIGLAAGNFINLDAAQYQLKGITGSSGEVFTGDGTWQPMPGSVLANQGLTMNSDTVQYGGIVKDLRFVTTDSLNGGIGFFGSMPSEGRQSNSYQSTGGNFTQVLHGDSITQWIFNPGQQYFTTSNGQLFNSHYQDSVGQYTRTSYGADSISNIYMLPSAVKIESFNASTLGSYFHVKPDSINITTPLIKLRGIAGAPGEFFAHDGTWQSPGGGGGGAINFVKSGLFLSADTVMLGGIVTENAIMLSESDDIVAFGTSDSPSPTRLSIFQALPNNTLMQASTISTGELSGINISRSFNNLTISSLNPTDTSTIVSTPDSINIKTDTLKLETPSIVLTGNTNVNGSGNLNFGNTTRFNSINLKSLNGLYLDINDGTASGTLDMTSSGCQLMFDDGTGTHGLILSTAPTPIQFYNGMVSFPGTSTSGAIKLMSVGTDPSAPTDGEMWYNNSSNKFKVRQNGSTVNAITANTAANDEIAMSLGSGSSIVGSGFTRTNSTRFTLPTVGQGIAIKEGTNATMGVTTLVGGTKVVSTTLAKTNSRIFLTIQSLGTVTVPKSIGVTARVNNTSFTITSGDATDTSIIAWMIIEPAP